jgi:hypothetical protein
MASDALTSRAKFYLRSLREFEPAVRPFLSRLGYELVGEGGWRHLADYRAFPTRLPVLLEEQPTDPYRTAFRVRLDDVTTRTGFSHGPEGWHPFVETLREYMADPGLRYENSTLARVYARYQPATTQEVLLDHIETPIEPFCRWPPDVNLFSWVWAHTPYSARRILNEVRDRGEDRAWRVFGPHSLEYGRKEFHRIIRVYESIKSEGFETEKHEGRPIDGYFLVRGDRYRFVLLHGNHRVAALKTLGYSEVNVRIRRSHPAVVDQAQLHRWSIGGGGLYPEETATALFEMLFTESGRSKAFRMGLIHTVNRHSGQ